MFIFHSMMQCLLFFFFFFSSRRRHTRLQGDWSSDVCSSDLTLATLTCTRSDALAASVSYAAITLTVDVATSAPASVTNSATVSGGGDTNTANDTATDPTTISPAGAPDLTITKTHVGNFTQGQTGASYAL